MLGMIASLCGYVKPLTSPPYIYIYIYFFFFFSLAYLTLLLLSCINTLICTDLLIPSITSQVAGAHNAWFPYS